MLQIYTLQSRLVFAADTSFRLKILFLSTQFSFQIRLDSRQYFSFHTDAQLEDTSLVCSHLLSGEGPSQTPGPEATSQWNRHHHQSLTKTIQWLGRVYMQDFFYLSQQGAAPLLPGRTSRLYP